MLNQPQSGNQKTILPGGIHSCLQEKTDHDILETSELKRPIMNSVDPQHNDREQSEKHNCTSFDEILSTSDNSFDSSVNPNSENLRNHDS